MSLDPRTQGDARSQTHAECCTGDCRVDDDCDCWCHFVFTNRDGTLREDAEALYAEIRRMKMEIDVAFAPRRNQQLN